MASQDDFTRVPIWPDGYQWGGNLVQSVDTSIAAISMIDVIGKAMSNPRYKSDLWSLDGNWKLEAVIGRKTVIIVVGSTGVTELLDRPVAEMLRDRIDTIASGIRDATAFHRGVVYSDAVWFGGENFFKDKPFIAIGAKDANRLTKWLIEAQSDRETHSEWGMGDGVRGVFSKSRGNSPQVALYGNTAAKTRQAVETYLDRQEGLASFLKMCWN
jgi:hypothetical protein